MISTDFNGASKTRNRVVVIAEIELRNASDNQPGREIFVSGTETDRLFDMGLGFLEASNIRLGDADYCVSFGKVRVHRQRTFAFGDSLRGAVCVGFDDSHDNMGSGMVRSDIQRLG